MNRKDHKDLKESTDWLFEVFEVFAVQFFTLSMTTPCFGTVAVY